jgi:5-methylcytosine-specific restriction endonuclease McrA
MTIHLNQYPALVLNADYTPKSIFPLSTLNWQEAAKGLFLGKYVRVADYPDVLRTRTQEYAFPSVIAMKRYVSVKGGVPFNRHNIWIRDEGKCAYCQTKLALDEFTFDHIVPQMHQGETTWENIVCACHRCNGEKAAKSLAASGKTLHVNPHVPTAYEIAAKAKRVGRFGPTPVEWIDYLYWETELER